MPPRYEIRSARSQVAQAEANLATLTENKTVEIASAREQVAQAETNLEALTQEEMGVIITGLKASLVKMEKAGRDIKKVERKSGLKKKQIGASVEYPVVLHELDYVTSLNPGLPPEGLQVSERCLRRICALPMFSTITEEQLDYVCEAIHMFYRESN